MLKNPIIGVGSSAYYFLPHVASKLNSKCIIPENADVASAIGAITSKVFVSKHVKIHPNKKNEYIIEGLRGRHSFSSLKEASQYATRKLINLVRNTALKAGTSEKKVNINVNDTYIHAPKNDYYFDEKVFVERTISANLKGPPDITKLQL